MREEPILVDEGVGRFTYFPIKHQDLHDFYLQHRHAFWTEEELDFEVDLKDWAKLSENEKFFIKSILSFFAASDGIVNENLAVNFLQEVKYPEAQSFYEFQIAMEKIHSITYSLLIDSYIKNPEEKDKCFNAIEHLPAVAKKANNSGDLITLFMEIGH